jgi:PTH1 family peptidyl-tRNA hydrolase
MVVDELADGATWRKNCEKSLECEAELEGEPVWLLKPQTYMNRSGSAVAPALNRLNANPNRMIVIHDDLDLSPGKVRIKVGGGDGGHRGIRSIADSLRFRDFIRVRLGIGRPPPGVTAEEFVLTAFVHEESLRRELVEAGCRAVRLVLTHGVEHAQNCLHSAKITGSFVLTVG